jgi:hypothetical protein
MDDSHDDPTPGMPLHERLWDLFVFVPAGIAASVVEDFPAVAERGRQKVGVRITSARAIGQFVVKAGQDELRRRTEGLRAKAPGPFSGDSGSDPAPATDPGRSDLAAEGEDVDDRGGLPDSRSTIPVAPPETTPTPSATATPSAPPVAPPETTPTPSATTPPATPPVALGNVPDVSSLSIPGFDTLSASQVVQRLDGLNRSELVAVRAYESSTRGRRTILSRVDQLLDERS